MKVGEVYQHIIDSLKTKYEIREAKNISQMLIERLTGFSNTERLIYKNDVLNGESTRQLNHFMLQLLNDRPIQYVLGEAWFCGLKLLVNESVLIPRPETEELVEWIIGKNKNGTFDNAGILDIGTGSGCIAIALKNKLPDIPVSALDYQAEIIELAKMNADRCQTQIHFMQKNILNVKNLQSLPVYDILVSNPPYVLKNEMNAMEKRVWGNEPHEALFVPNEDPLIFYKNIVDFSEKHLKKEGQIFFEINPEQAPDLKALLEEKGFGEIILKKDMRGCIRMMNALKK
ncbi:MAG: peptide chain release factor N(5)-glutamine methyltransferase [Bacteroidetes bacterium]|nr:peptide chain release factor N(5)-glutamine methyltransferase [Bacteroidota bacterium]